MPFQVSEFYVAKKSCMSYCDIPVIIILSNYLASLLRSGISFTCDNKGVFLTSFAGSPCSDDGAPWKDATEGKHGNPIFLYYPA